MDKEFGKWTKTETLTTTKYHYFPTNKDESLCGKLFNLDLKVKKEVEVYCSTCQEKLTGFIKNQETRKEKNMFEELLEEQCITT